MTNPVTVSVRLGDISNAIGSLIADGASTIPLLTGNTPLTPIQVLNGVDLLVSTVGASATVLKNFAEVFERFPNVVGPLQAAGVVANAATVSSGFTKIVDAFARNDSEQFAVGLLDVIGGGAGLLGLIAAYTPLATLIQGSALIAKTYIGSNPGALAAAIKDLTKGFDSLLGAIGSAVNTNFTSALNWTAPRDPLVLDLDGDGIEAVGINPANPVTFDHDADGLRTGTGWIKADDGLVVLDLNGNGTIDTGRELFGDNTLLPNGQTASNGYQALGQHDTNGDGRINSQDTIYTQLRVWQDANQDGISQTNELRTLAQVGIASINTAGTASNVNLGNGNSQPFRGGKTCHVSRTDASTGTSGVSRIRGGTYMQKAYQQQAWR